MSLIIKRTNIKLPVLIRVIHVKIVNEQGSEGDVNQPQSLHTHRVMTGHLISQVKTPVWVYHGKGLSVVFFFFLHTLM